MICFGDVSLSERVTDVMTAMFYREYNRHKITPQMTEIIGVC